MPRVLHVIPSLDYSGSAKQLSLLLNTAKSHDQRVCVLGAGGPLLQGLERAGMTVDVLNWTRPLNPLPLWRLRRLIQEWRPQVIHAWKMSSVRALALVGRRLACPTIVQSSWSAHRELNRLDAWLLRRVSRIIARGNTDADWLRAQGVTSEKIVVIPPGVEAVPSALPAGERQNRRVMCAGRLEERRGYYDAIWAVDILKYIYDDIHLDVVGDGPDRDRLEHFTRSIDAGDYVHFLSTPNDLPLSEADIVWVPSRREAGVNIALEAMIRGVPVIASTMGTLRELITHGETGFLMEPQDKVALARCTRLLFDDPNLHARLAAAARECARRQFSAAKMADGISQLHQDIAA